MTDIPAVSVVIPLYNKGPYIARALNSVLAQTFQDFEVIVVDDGSTDDGVEVVRTFDDPRIQLIQQENAGVSAARNRGIDLAEAELIAFLDADDEWLPKHLETLLNLRGSYPEAGLIFTSFKVINSCNKVTWPKIKAVPLDPWEGLLPSYFLAAVSCSMLISTSGVAVPKDILIELAGFNEFVSIFEDSDLWGRIALKYPVAFSWKCGSIYHCEAINRSFESRELIVQHPFIESAKKINSAHNGVNIYKKEDLDEYVERLKLSYAIENVKAGKTSLARSILKNCKTNLNYKKKVLWYGLSFIPIRVLRYLYVVVRFVMQKCVI